MSVRLRRSSIPLFISIVVLSGPALGDGPRGFLTEPATGAPREVALEYLISHREKLGLTSGDLSDVLVRDEYTSRHNGVTHVYFRQRLDGVEVVNGDINVNVTADGRIASLGNGFVPDLAAAANTRAPSLSQEQAVARAADHLGLTQSEPLELLEVVGGPALEVIFSGAGLSQDAIPVKLMYLPLRDGSAVLVWSLVIREVDDPDWWNLLVDANSGEVREKFNWTADSGRATRPIAGGVASQPESAGIDGVCTDCYTVFALPKESPLNGPRTEEVTPWDTLASPFGWHDIDGAPGAEFNDSRGNNVEAQTDLDANNVFGGPDIRAEGGPDRVFDFPLDLDLDPSTYRPAAVTNLFYWNNIMHDIAYRYGFDEASGNFQQNNYGRGGAQGDPVQADAQDGSGTNNANFATPPDGFDPRMQMFIWLPPFINVLTVNSPPTIAGDYVASSAAFGPPAGGETGDLTFVNDGVGPDPNDGCEPFGMPAGNIALIRRGNCSFVTKVRNAQTGGAVAAIIQKITPGNPVTLGDDGTGGDIVIPSGMITQADGEILIAELQTSTVNGTFRPNPSPPPNRDSDLEAGIINHEYGHGVSNRLVGGPSSVNCLQNNEQMGEGLSDWWTLVLSALPSHNGEMARGIGNYVSFEPIDGPGIRPFPYSTDMTVNPQTYADIGTAAVPHGVGAVFNAMIWEMYWLLVAREGFNPDFYNGSGGNNLAIQLVMDGMKMVTCSPSFLDLRDAILTSDLINYGGAYECEIWTAFAKRGAGWSADAGSPFAVGDETEAFDFPPGLDPACATAIFTDGFESGDTSVWSFTLP